MNEETLQSSLHNGQDLATLGGGCFWCLEAVYLECKGVDKVVSGYCGGSVPNPRTTCGRRFSETAIGSNARR